MPEPTDFGTTVGDPPRLTAAPASDRLAAMARPNLRRRAFRLLAPLAVLFFVAGPVAAAAQLSSRAVADSGPRSWAITDGMVHVGDGTVLDQATVVIRDGLIVSVEAGGQIPAGTARMDAAGKHVYPGFITALSDLGLGGGSPQGREGAGPGGREERAASFPGTRRPAGHVLVAARGRRPPGGGRTDRHPPERRVHLGGFGAGGRDHQRPGRLS